MKRLNLLLHLLVFLLFGAELYSRWMEYHTLEYITKPWLLIWIAVYYYLNTTAESRNMYVLLAFAFSWIGDMFLMVAHVRDYFFFAGVGGFFLAQLSYIKSFTEFNRSKAKGYLQRNPFMLIPFLMYLFLILYLILGGMEGLMVPVIIVYAITLIGMSAAALNRKGLSDHKSFWLVFTGSVLFVMSDSMIAINKFYLEFSHSSFLVMLTYFVAQYLIMKGLIEDKR